MPSETTAPGPRPPWWAKYAAIVVAVHAGGFVWSLVGMPQRPLLALAVAGSVAASLLLALRRLWPRRGARIVVRAVVAAHVVFWTGAGLLGSPPREAGAIRAGIASVWAGEPRPFEAGVGEATFRLTERDVLAGYGARPRRIALPWLSPGPLGRASARAMCALDDAGEASVPMFRRGKPAKDLLGAKAVVVRPATGKGPPLAICRLDLIMVDARLHSAVHDRVSDLGFTRDTVLLAATHTHGGPGGFCDALLAQALATGAYSRDVFERVVAAATTAIRAAWKDAVPARIGFVRARDVGPDGKPCLAKNRTGDPDRVDSEVLGIRLDAADGSRRIALVLNYAVHPVWSRPKDETFSGDLARRLEESREIASNATVLFVNGAEGDVRPRIPAMHPEHPDRGNTIAAFERAVSSRLAPLATHETLRVAAATAWRDYGTPRYVVSLVGPREATLAAADHPFGPGFGGAAAGLVTLPVNALLWSTVGPDARITGSFSGGIGAVINLDAWVDHTRYGVGAVRLQTPEGTAAIVWVPGEPNTSVGERLKAAARLRGANPVFVFGLTNDYMAYAAAPEDCAAGGYEAGNTLFGPETAVRLEEAAEAALDAVGLWPPGKAPPGPDPQGAGGR